MHNGPLLGHSRAEARAGFQRALELNPDLIPVYEHLMLVAIQDRDTATAAQGLRELVRLDAGPHLSADGYGNRMLQFRFLDAIVRGDTGLTRALTDSMARDPAPQAVGDGSFYDPFRYGFPAEQIRVSERALRVGGTPARMAVHGRLLALSWAARGAWDSALVAMDQFVRSGTDREAALRAYGLAVVGVWLGAVNQREADARRQAAVTVAQANAADRAEIAWLDGLVAVSRGDRSGIADARAAIQRTGDSSATALDRSLAAFDAALGGNKARAGKAMAELEWQEAATGARAFVRHPYTIPVDRLAAARWLAESGDGEQALRLLAVVDGPYLLHPSTPYSIMLTPLADLERARIEERQGRTELARNYYEEFLRIYDRPVAAHRSLVEEANGAVRRSP